MAATTPAHRMEQVIRAYIRAGNDDAEAIAVCFCPDAVHFSPTNLQVVGAATIASNLATRVPELGIYFTVDQLLVDVDRGCCGARMDDVYAKTCADRPPWVRVVGVPAADVAYSGSAWYSAAPLDSGVTRQELLDFDYAGRAIQWRCLLIASDETRAR